MISYVVRRLIRSIPVLLGVSILVFSIVALLPGDPVMYMFQGTALSAEHIRQAHETLGFDRPVHTRYLHWLGGVLRGDLGKSVRADRPVTGLLLRVFPETVKLAVSSMVLATVLGIAAGVISAVGRDTWVDSGTMALTTAGISMPVFWFGLLMLWYFAVERRWFPVASGYTWQGLVLPAFTLGVRASCFIARLTRSSMLDVLCQDYVRTARAKGLTEQLVILRHGLQNALIPVVTALGLQLGWMLGGAVIVEVVFARPGIGRLIVDAIQTHDFPVVQGGVLLIAACYIIVNLVVDVCYAYLDPRIRY